VYQPQYFPLGVNMGAEDAEAEAEVEAAALAMLDEDDLAALEEDGLEAPELDEEMQAAIAGAVASSPTLEAEEEEAEENEDAEQAVAEHLRDSVEGSFRVKRMLEQDDDEPGSKRPKMVKLTPEEEMVHKLLVKWSLQLDQITKYVLSHFTLEELKMLDGNGYMPDKFNTYKIPAELLARYANECRERKGPGGGPLDVVSSFKFRWKLGAPHDKMLRSLCHKDLRYVLNHYAGDRPLEEAVKEANKHVPEEGVAESAYPDGPGVSTIGRFGRLELIDALADSAVFGDANLTFALKIAKHRKAMGHVGRVIATTFEDLPTLRERYTEVDDSIKVLEEHFAEVWHSVDCNRIAVDSRFEGLEGSLGAVYYNFPHSGAVGGFF
jgi:hypothetical protein